MTLLSPIRRVEILRIELGSNVSDKTVNPYYKRFSHLILNLCKSSRESRIVPVNVKVHSPSQHIRTHTYILQVHKPGRLVQKEEIKFSKNI